MFGIIEALRKESEAQALDDVAGIAVTSRTTGASATMGSVSSRSTGLISPCGMRGGLFATAERAVLRQVRERHSDRPSSSSAERRVDDSVERCAGSSAERRAGSSAERRAAALASGAAAGGRFTRMPCPRQFSHAGSRGGRHAEPWRGHRAGPRLPPQTIPRGRGAAAGSTSIAAGLTPPRPATASSATVDESTVQRLREELREAQRALQFHGTQVRQVQEQRDEGKKQSMELESAMCTMQQQLEVATERTQFLEQRVAFMHHELKAKSSGPGFSTLSQAPSSVSVAMGTLVSARIVPSPLLDMERQVVPESVPDSMPSEHYGMTVFSSDPGVEDFDASRDPAFSFEAPPSPTMAAVAAAAAAVAAAASSPAEALGDAELRAAVPGAAAAAQGTAPGEEDLWDFVVQGRCHESKQSEPTSKGVTCFPASALERLAQRGVSFVCARGRRLDASAPNQDDLVLAMCRCPHNGCVALYGVFDGHGPAGHQCAAFARGFLPERIFGDAALLAEPEAVLRSAFEEVQQSLLAREGSMPAMDSRASGTTATVALVLRLPVALAPAGVGNVVGSPRRDDTSAERLGTWVFVAHIGDSRAVLGTCIDGEVCVRPLTREHRPDDAEEAARIAQAGGEVRRLKAGRSASRIFLPGKSQPGLALSRVLGDTAEGSFGVTAEPDIVSFFVRPREDVLLLLGTDGFWEFCSMQEVVSELARDGAALETLEAFVAESRRRWARNSYNQTCDDATAIAVSLSSRNE